MDIQDIRRANLARWLETHSVPQREKSLFSQLKGTGSFGERVARRLETEYGMGVGFLDTQVGVNSANREVKPALSADAEQLISWVRRLDGLGGQAQEVFRNVANILALAHHGALTQNARAVQSLIAEEDSLRAIAYGTEEKAIQNAPRKRAAKHGS